MTIMDVKAITAITQRLAGELAAVCPIDGVSLGDVSDKATWRIDFSEAASREQRSAAANIVSAFDVVRASSPTTVTALQARLALLQMGLLDVVNDAVKAGPAEIRVAWEYSTEVRRDDPGVVVLAEKLGISDRLPYLFELAATL